MDKLINKIRQYYPNQILAIRKTGTVELAIFVNPNIDIAAFAQTFKDHIITIVDELSIVKINILDSKGNLAETFATNQ